MLLTIQNIQKYFGAELCLRNISCVLDAQDRAGIIGENGAGKTTLIKIITGELYPDDGIVTLAHGDDGRVSGTEQRAGPRMHGIWRNGKRVSFRFGRDGRDEASGASDGGVSGATICFWNVMRSSPPL